MDRLVWLSALTYFLLVASFIFSYYVSKGRFRMAVIVIGAGALALLTWVLIDNAVMDYQDANIGLGLVLYLIWIITFFSFLFAIFTFFFSKKGK